VTHWRLIRSDGVRAAAGLAADEALTAGYSRFSPLRPPTVRLYTYHDHCALVGRYQSLDAEVDVAACRARGIEYNRRPTGGGAIIMGAGQLGVAVATRAPSERRPRELLEELSGGIVTGLSRLGIAATFRGKNDLAVGGRKIAGLGLYLDGLGGLLFHASVLADLDVDLMLGVLRIPAAKLGDRAAQAVCERVTTVTRETGHAWDGAALAAEIAAGFAAWLGIDFEFGAMRPEEEALAASLVEKRYGRDEWRAECSPRSDVTATTVARLGAGTVRIYIAVHGQAIKSILFTGDFNSVPASLVAIEEGLRWKRLERSAVEQVVRRCAQDSPEIGDPALLIEAILSLGERVSHPPSAAPEREGSCYFPEGVGQR
jgi:lipoate-protein ligase A